MPSFAVIGPGALGILFAVKLSRAGHSIFLLDYKEERAAHLNSSGLRVLEKDGQLSARPRVTVLPETIQPPPEFVLVLVKAYQTESILPALGKLISDETIVASLQNGIGAGEILEKVVPAKNLCLGTTTHGANIVSEDTVRHAGSGPTVIGPYSAGDMPDKIHQLSRVFNEASFETMVTRDIYPELWKKLLVNIGINPLTALTGLRNGQILDHTEILQIQEMAVREAFEIVRLAGIDLNMDIDTCLETVRTVCRKTSKNRSSMLQDRINKRQTEIEFITGAILKIAGKLGMQAPVNEVLTNLVIFNSAERWDQFLPLV